MEVSSASRANTTVLPSHAPATGGARRARAKDGAEGGGCIKLLEVKRGGVGRVCVREITDFTIKKIRALLNKEEIATTA